jgi:hypothetical protein
MVPRSYLFSHHSGAKAPLKPALWNF